MQKKYHQSMHARLHPRTAFTGGRITDIDLLSLDEAAAIATNHAKTQITAQDILRAAGRGEIRLHAIVHQDARLQKYDGGIFCNEGASDENMIPKGAIPVLPASACRHLANSGHASWREIERYETVDGEWMRFVIASLVHGEPDFETSLEDCRVIGYDLHALADAFIIDDKKVSDQDHKAESDQDHKAESDQDHKLESGQDHKPESGQDHKPESDSSSSNPEGVTKQQILLAFEVAVGKKYNLRKAMGDGKTKWLFESNIKKGKPGRGRERAQWNPVILATHLCDKEYITTQQANNAFCQWKFLKEWREEWENWREKWES